MQQWIKIRKELNQQLKNQVRLMLGKDSAVIKKYQTAYENDLKAKWKISSREELLKKAETVDFIFLGDFHALQQSQKAHMRILKGLSLRKKVILYVEFFESRHQVLLDRYLDGKLTEKDFLKKINWEKKWGFPWDAYKPIVRWAQKNKIKMIALDKRDENSLLKRDVLAAKMIAHHFRHQRQRQQSCQHIVIYGDLHIAKKRIPQLVSRYCRIDFNQFLLVYQNSEKVYFKLLEKGLEFQVDVVKISSHQYCILNVPPWVKWQHYLNFLEHKYDKNYELSGADPTDQVLRYLKLMGKELAVPSEDFQPVIYSPESSGFWKIVSEKTSQQQKEWLEALIENSNSFYYPPKKIGYLAVPTVNHAAGLSMAIVYEKLSRSQYFPHQMPEDFLKLIWLECIMYFGSKLINPKRKTDTVFDIKASLSMAFFPERMQEALKLALSQKMSELIYLSTRKKNRSLFKPKKIQSYREAARLLGGMLGEKLYHAYRKRLISEFSLKSILSKSNAMRAEEFKNVYYEIIETIETFPEPFQSKVEKL
jgi:hypothetical protein